MNFETGKIIKYGAYGECKIIDRREEFLGGRLREFYILNQVTNASSTIYVPVEKSDSFKEVKKALTVEQINALRFVKAADIDWNEDDKKRDAKFRQAFERADAEEITAILKGIADRQSELKSAKKKLRATDANAMKICERILYDEISRTANIKPEDVISIAVDGKAVNSL